jgi:hypothetical protein
VEVELEQSEGDQDGADFDGEIAVKLNDFTSHMNKVYMEDVSELQQQLEDRDARILALQKALAAQQRPMLEYSSTPHTAAECW